MSLSSLVSSFTYYQVGQGAGGWGRKGKPGLQAIGHSVFTCAL